MKNINITYHYTENENTSCENCVTLSVTEEIAKSLTSGYCLDTRNPSYNWLAEIVTRLVIMQGGRQGNIVDIREA